MKRTMRLDNFYEQHYVPRKLRGAQPSTLKSHRITLGQFSEYLGRPAKVSDLTDENVGGFAWSRVEAGKSHITACYQGRALVAWWRFAARQGLLTVWPDVDLPKPIVRVPVAWTRDEMRKIDEICQTVPGDFSGVPRNLWLHAIHRVLLDSGERINAVLNLAWNDTDLRGGWVLFRGEHRKFRKSDRQNKLGPATIDALRAIELPERKLVFPLSPALSSTGRIQTWYGKLLEKGGLPNDRHHKFHCWRRTVASYAEQNGLDATSILDHSQRSVTLGYLDPRVVERKHACDVLGGLFNEEQAEPAPVTDGKWNHTTTITIDGTRYEIGKGPATLFLVLCNHPDGVEVHSIPLLLREAGMKSGRNWWPFVAPLRDFLREVYRLPDFWEPIEKTLTGKVFNEGKRGVPVRETILRLNLPTRDAG